MTARPSTIITDADLRDQASRRLRHSTGIYIWSTPFEDPKDPGELTLAWLAAHSPNNRDNCLNVLASWLHHTTIPLIAGPEMVEGWLDEMSSAPHRESARPASAVGRRLAILTSWYAFLNRHGACHGNPAARVKAPPPTGNRRSKPALPCAAGAVLVELSRAHAEASPHERTWRDHCVVAALFHLGLPARTLAALTVHDHCVGVRTGGTISLWTGPHHPANTLLDLPDAVAHPLRAYLDLRAERQDAPVRHGPILGTIPHPSGSPTVPLTAPQIGRIVQELCEAAGFPARTRLAPCPSPPLNPVLPRIADAPDSDLADLRTVGFPAATPAGAP